MPVAMATAGPIDQCNEAGNKIESTTTCCGMNTKMAGIGHKF